jgi:hypothetical protein
MAPWAWHPTTTTTASSPALPNEPEGPAGGNEGVGNVEHGGEDAGGSGMHNDMFRFALVLTGLIGGLGLLATLAFCYGSFRAKKRARRLEKEERADDEQLTHAQQSRTTAERVDVLGAAAGAAAGTLASRTHRAIGGGSHPATTTTSGGAGGGRSVRFAVPEAQVQVHPQAPVGVQREQMTPPPAQGNGQADEREHEQKQQIMPPKRI